MHTEEMKRITAGLDETFRELDAIKDRLCAQVVELAALRRDMEAADERRMARAYADEAAFRVRGAGVVPVAPVVVGIDWAETHHHCGIRETCTCPAGPPARDCPWRVVNGCTGPLAEQRRA